MRNSSGDKEEIEEKTKQKERKGEMQIEKFRAIELNSTKSI